MKQFVKYFHGIFYVICFEKYDINFFDVICFEFDEICFEKYFREIFCDILLLRLIFHETFCEIFSWIFHTFHTCHIFSIGFNNSTYFTIVHFQVIQVHSTVTNATVRNPPRPAAMPRHWHSPGCQWQAPSEAPGGTGRAGTSIIIGS